MIAILIIQLITDYYEYHKRQKKISICALNDGHKLSKEEKDLIKEDAKVRHAKRSPECLVRNECFQYFIV
ncbi:hypothetical protein CS542_02315 [Pedobacter sp. IW39]|nr:hypothetical protein CS542_02315 [Pedobacter sp. IW39]